jgi:hypothetical protein
MTDTKPENPPAFPTPEIALRSVMTGAPTALTDAERYIARVIPGMDLRDYFAAHAPFSCEDAAQTLAREGLKEVSHATIYRRLSRMRFAYADAMLRARAA